jgi:uncharacterized membrane protein
MTRGTSGGYPTSDRWAHRPDVWSGLVLAGALAGRSFQPSLMPRATAHQAIVAGASGAIGFGLASGSYGLVARTGSPLADAALLSGTTVAGFAASRLLKETHDEAEWHQFARTAGSAIAAGSTAAALGVLVRGVRPDRRYLAGTALTVAAGLTSARAIQQGLSAQRKAHDEYDPPPPQPLPALTQSVGIAAGLTTVVSAFRHSSGIAGRVLERRLGVPAPAATWLGRGIAVGAWFGIGKALADTFVRGLRVYDRVVDAGFDRAPSSPMRSSGDGSPIPFARLGREGRRFVLNVPEVDEISSVMGRPAQQEPIRVFVGYSAARTDEERVALAVDELHRTGAFDRSLLLVGCPAGNGYVNTLPLEVTDYLTLGDCAAVAVQYGRLPSILTLQRVTRGGAVQRALLEAIASVLAERPSDQRPRVVVYGESLGAWAGQDTFLHQGIAGLDELGVDRALWAGTPYYSGWRKEVLVDRSVEVPDGSVMEIDRPDPLLALEADERAKLRAVVLGHGNDPVRYICLGMFVRRPAWLSGTRPWGVPPTMGWLPGITGIQVIVDALNAMRPVPGVFRATGHEYTADLPDVTVAAYALDAPEPGVWASLIEHLKAVDADRASHSRLARTPRPEADGDGAAGGHGHGGAHRSGRRRRKLALPGRRHRAR